MHVSRPNRMCRELMDVDGDRVSLDSKSHLARRALTSSLRQLGFTLIELMIVVAIIGILASIALPQYQDYVSRSRWSDSFSSVAQVKAAVAECLQNQGGANNGPANCSDDSAGGSLQTSGYLPANWAGPVAPTYGSAPVLSLVGTNGVTIQLTGNTLTGSCIVELRGTAAANQLNWQFVNAGGPSGCNRAKTGVGT